MPGPALLTRLAGWACPHFCVPLCATPGTGPAQEVKHQACGCVMQPVYR